MFIFSEANIDEHNAMYNKITQMKNENAIKSKNMGTNWNSKGKNQQKWKKK